MAHLRVVVLGVMQSQDLVSHNLMGEYFHQKYSQSGAGKRVNTHIFTALEPLWESHRDLRSGLGEEIRAPDARDWSSLDARQLLEFHPNKLLGNGLRAPSWTFRKVGHNRAMVVVWAQSGVTRWPEARTVPIEGHIGPSLGIRRDRSRTSNLVAGNLHTERAKLASKTVPDCAYIGAVDIVKGSVAASVGPNNRWRSWRETSCP